MRTTDYERFHLLRSLATAWKHGTPHGRREREADDDRDDRLRLVDWYFYGRQNAKVSYGRHGDGFTSLEPTPGRANAPSSTERRRTVK